MEIYDKAPTFWLDPKTAVIEHLRIENMKYNITQLVISTHLGTHLDAPFHFFDSGRTVDRLDLSRGFGPASVLDFSAKGPKGIITREDLVKHDTLLVQNARIIIRTGWDHVFPAPRYFTDYPGIDPEACELLAERKVACLAMDMPSIYGPDYVTVHQALLRAEVLIVEGLANLDRLKGTTVFFAALPLRIRGRDGSPCRAIAVDGLNDAELKLFGGIDHYEAPGT